MSNEVSENSQAAEQTADSDPLINPATEWCTLGGDGVVAGKMTMGGEVWLCLAIENSQEAIRMYCVTSSKNTINNLIAALQSIRDEVFPKEEANAADPGPA